jgi:hypothetical protein
LNQKNNNEYSKQYSWQLFYLILMILQNIGLMWSPQVLQF